MVHDALTPEKLGALAPAEAAAYFIMRRAEGLTVSEQQLFTGWLASNEAHRQAFASSDRAWQTFAEPEGNEILAAMRVHARAARRRGLPAWWPAAAAAALLVGATVILMPSLRGTDSQRNPPSVVAAIQYSSARGAVKDFKLPDGSTMTLDADSAAVGRFGTDRRTVQLVRGRAFFTVARDRSRPFAVDAGGHSVVAVGTRFDVNLLAEGLTVTLLDGTVDITSLRAPSPAVRLEPGQQYAERFGKAVVTTLGGHDENAVAWRTGLISFDDQPLAEVVEVMNRYSQDQIVVNDPAVAAIKVSGQFHAGDAARFVETLVELHKLQAIRKANQIELRAGP